MSRLMMRRRGGGGFSPADIADMALWFDAGGITGLVDGDPVATWSDDSGNARDLTQSTAARRPIYKTAIVNGHPVVRFDGVDDYLITPQFLHTGAYSIFAVVKRTSGTSNAAVVDADQFAARQFQFRYSNTTTLQLITFTSAQNPEIDTEPATPTNWNVAAGIARPTEAQVYVNGATDGATARSGTNAAHTSWFAAGVSGGGGGGFPSFNWLNGDIAEILYYARDLTATERNDLTAHLGNKYGITIA